MTPDEVFTEHRPLLFTVGYEILGTVADTEDVLHDSYLRWREVDQTGVDAPRAYLVRIVARQALNHLRGAKRRREDYVGSWLPEPVRTAPDASEDAVLAESVSMAMLLVLETLSPDERVVFVLDEVFDFTHHEIADMIGKTDANVRQIAHRAREHVRARRTRFRPDTGTAHLTVNAFLLAARTGDVRALMDLMAPDVVQISDGGGKVTAARNPIHGHELVARFVAGVARNEPTDLLIEAGEYNALPSILVRPADGDGPGYVLVFDIADGLIRTIYAVRNPDKLTTVATLRPLTRH